MVWMLNEINMLKDSSEHKASQVLAADYLVHYSYINISWRHAS